MAVNDDASIPRVVARADGESAALCSVLAICASAPEEEPALMTTTSASTAWTATVGEMSPADTLSSAAIALVSMMGAARELLLVWSSWRVTVKEALVESARPEVS